jgi:hypothetical protein
MRRSLQDDAKLLQRRNKPLLLVDVDGVISLFGFSSDSRPAGAWMNVDGIRHRISATAGAHLQALAATFDLVWCTGWEEKANEHLVRALRRPCWWRPKRTWGSPTRTREGSSAGPPASGPAALDTRSSVSVH